MDGMRMTRATLIELVSQAEREGITLAEVISRTLSPRDLDLIQSNLEDELSENYRKIEDFMGGVEVPSLTELMDLDTFEELGTELTA
jgi:hypothetical protein